MTIFFIIAFSHSSLLKILYIYVKRKEKHILFLYFFNCSVNFFLDFLLKLSYDNFFNTKATMIRSSLLELAGNNLTFVEYIILNIAIVFFL